MKVFIMTDLEGISCRQSGILDTALSTLRQVDNEKL